MSNVMIEKASVRIVVRVQPNASQNELLGFKDGVLRLRIAAPPTKGKANRELVTFLSDILGVSKRDLIIEKGMTGKRKVIRVSGLTQSEVIERTTGHLTADVQLS